jgi:hypothetical protein
MKIKFKMGEGCFNAANQASGGVLNREDIEAAFQRIGEYKQRLQSTGDTANMADKLRAFAEREAERTKVAAALQKRQAALNILVRDRLEQSIDSFVAAGMTERQALLAIVEGTQRGVQGGRNSIAALTGAYEARYLGGMLAEIQANRPHLVSVLRDPRMDADVLKEMAELREGGRPGITGNDDAQYIAKVFATYSELARSDLNSLGASIGKLEGWAGAQTHDDVKIIAAGKEAWIDAIMPRLDIDRTFPDVASLDEVRSALSDIYDTIVTGLPNKPSPRELGQRVNPANLAKSLGKSRVLHFRDADAALSYRDEFGYGNTVSGIISHLRNSARIAANMDVLGPNPEVMYGAVAESLKRKLKTGGLSPDVKQKRIRELNIDAGALRQAIDISTGLVSRPVSVTAAKIGADLRAWQSMAKLGGAVLSSISDTITPAIAAQFRGSSFFRSWVAQLDGLRKGRPTGEVAEISYLLGEGFDGILGHIVSPSAATDSPVGRMAGLQEKFFRWNGLTWWTDVQRASAGRMIAAEMGMRAQSSFDALPDNYRHVLGLHDIDAAKWEIIRKANFREEGGNVYVTPDRIRALPDDEIATLVSSRLEGKTEEQRAAIIDKARRDLELSVLRFFADETSYGVVEVDARTRRTMTLGMRPGTFAGEAIRFIGQFKGFPVAFTQRVGGRAIYGHRKGAKLADKAIHIGTLLGAMTMAGYASMTLKDLAKGYWPPRDPAELKTWQAAFIQGGAAGIYGDFLFSKVNRFGGGLTETAIGPTAGAVADFLELGLKARDAALSEDDKVKLADYLNFGTQNTPLINLFYTRPALDFLFLNSIRESASPGYMRRTAARRKTEYGQTNVLGAL